MNRFPLISISFTVGLVAIVLALSVIFISAPGAEARRLLVTEGDIYRVSNVSGANRLTSAKDIEVLFDERENNLLVGRGLEGGTPETAHTDGTRLHLVKNDTGQMVSLSEKLVEKAFFDSRASIAYFVTVEKELYLVQLDTGSSQRIKERVLDPSLSPDSKFMVYSKLNSDWSPGQYYDKALGLAVLDLQTGEEKMLTSSWEDFDPSWTPDGSRIVFLSSVKVNQPSTSQTVSLNDHRQVPSSHVNLVHEGSIKTSLEPTAEATPVNLNGTSRGEFATVTIPGIIEDHTTYFSIKPDGTERSQLIPTNDLYNRDRKAPVPSSELSWSRDGKTFVYDSDGVIWKVAFNRDFRSLNASRVGAGRNPKWVENSTLISALSPTSVRNIITIDSQANSL